MSVKQKKRTNTFSPVARSFEKRYTDWELPQETGLLYYVWLNLLLSPIGELFIKVVFTAANLITVANRQICASCDSRAPNPSKLSPDCRILLSSLPWIGPNWCVLSLIRSLLVDHRVLRCRVFLVKFCESPFHNVPVKLPYLSSTVDRIY